MANQKAENLLNLALETPDSQREQSGNLNVGYNVTNQTWEFIIKYSNSLEGLKIEFPEVVVEELLLGYAILTVPERSVKAVLSPLKYKKLFLP